MISALVAIISLNYTCSLIMNYGVVAGTMAITDVSTTTPIIITVPNHGIPMGRLIHGIVDEVVGITITNQTAYGWDALGWLGVLTPVDEDTFALTTFDAQGNVLAPAATGTYASGGRIRYAFPDGQILLGRRNVNTATQVVTPRCVMWPTSGKGWDFGSFVGAGPNLQPAEVPNVRGSAQSQSMLRGPQVATEFLTFEVLINGSGPNYGDPLAPDAEDFDATHALVHAFAVVLYAGAGAGVQILRESWPSQGQDRGLMTQRGQQWSGVVQVEVPVIAPLAPFVPIGVTGGMIVQPINPLVPQDQTHIDF